MKTFIKDIKQQFDLMCKTGKLFRVDISGQTIWNTYITSFSNSENPKFRDPDSSTHNCNNCKNFIRRYGNIVAIDDNGELITLFGGNNTEVQYMNAANVLNDLIKSSTIANVFFETYDELNSLPYESCNKTQSKYRLGIDSNFKKYTAEEVAIFGVVTEDKVYTFNHLHLDVPTKFVDKSGRSIEAIMAYYRDKYNVFKRAMKEISLDTLELVKDLITQGSLLDGTAHLHSIDEMISYVKIQPLNCNLDIWYWLTIYNMDERVAKFRNTLIGVLCVELTEGEELNKACTNWNKRVDPANYHKATAPITKKQIEEAQTFVTENGYLESFDRRLATIDDINVTEIKHISTDNGIKPVTIFDNVKSTSTQHKRANFDKIEEISIDKFMSDILPVCTSVEAYVTNKHEGNLVTLTTANIADSKPIFKWNNNYSWTFNGNLAGKSQIKEAVKLQGGKVDGVLRFSINWAEGDASDNSDLDAWASESNETMIGFDTGYRKDDGNRRTPMSGQLDVDITQPRDRGNKNIVENIAWDDLSKMKDGIYTLWVNQYAGRGSKGFKAEIEFDDQIYSYEYNNRVVGNVIIAHVDLKDGKFTIRHSLPCGNSNKDIWNVETNNFHKVNLVCLSPNHWRDNEVGNKHYMFMLNECKADGIIRGFHNENLLTNLLTYRKVMEVLGNTNMITPTGKQLSGIGFNATVRDELIVKVAGSFKRMLKIKF